METTTENSRQDGFDSNNFIEGESKELTEKEKHEKHQKRVQSAIVMLKKTDLASLERINIPFEFKEEYRAMSGGIISSLLGEESKIGSPKDRAIYTKAITSLNNILKKGTQEVAEYKAPLNVLSKHILASKNKDSLAIEEMKRDLKLVIVAYDDKVKLELEKEVNRKKGLMSVYNLTIGSEDFDKKAMLHGELLRITEIGRPVEDVYGDMIVEAEELYSKSLSSLEASLVAIKVEKQTKLAVQEGLLSRSIEGLGGVPLNLYLEELEGIEYEDELGLLSSERIAYIKERIKEEAFKEKEFKIVAKRDSFNKSIALWMKKLTDANLSGSLEGNKKLAVAIDRFIGTSKGGDITALQTMNDFVLKVKIKKQEEAKQAEAEAKVEAKQAEDEAKVEAKQAEDEAKQAEAKQAKQAEAKQAEAEAKQAKQAEAKQAEDEAKQAKQAELDEQAEDEAKQAKQAELDEQAEIDDETGFFENLGGERKKKEVLLSNKFNVFDDQVVGFWAEINAVIDKYKV